MSRVGANVGFAGIVTALVVVGWLATTAFARPSRTATAQAPGGLTAYGRLVWNFEGLLARTLGSPDACMSTLSGGSSRGWSLSACKVPLADQTDWQPVFARHAATTFSTTDTRPPKYGTMSWPNAAPIRIAGLFVRCSPQTWLVENGVGYWLCIAP